MRFTKINFSALLILTALLFVPTANGQTPTPTPPEDDEPVNIFVEEIKLNVSAFDRSGKFAEGVKKDDLVIVEDDRLHQPSSIRRVPANVLIVLDTGGEMRNVKSLSQTRLTASALVKQLSDEDSVALLEYNDKAKILLEWTSDKAKILKAINRDLDFGKRSLFVEGLKLARLFLQNSENENRQLVLITDGTDSLNRKSEMTAAMQDLMTTNINVHVLSYTKLEAAKVEPKTKSATSSPPPKIIPDEVAATMPNADLNKGKVNILTINTDRKFLKKMRQRKKSLDEGGAFLRVLSENTSGLYILPETTDEMLEKTSLISNVIDSNYVVTYTPKRALSESPDGEIRNIEISSRRPGLEVLARRKLIVRNDTKQ